MPRTEPDFDRVARMYRWAEYLALGPLLQQTRTALLGRLGHCRQALLFGDGDGRFAVRLLSEHPAMHAAAVDTSRSMLELLRRRCVSAEVANRLTVRRTSALEAAIPKSTDLVVTHFFLDCLSQNDVVALTRRVAAALQPGALWLVSDFAVPGSPLLRHAARAYIRLLYLAFRMLTRLPVQQLPDPQTALARSGFQRLVRREKLGGFLYSELWLLLPPGDGTTRPRPDSSTTV